MSNPRCFATIDMREINSSFKHNGTEILTIDIKYPVIHTFNNPIAEKKINNQISEQVDEYFQYITTKLYEEAMITYEESLEKDFPYRAYEVFMQYTITYNDNCFLSLYADKYEFTGGAHGNTTRVSSTWELCTGESIYLYCFFKPGTDYKYLIIQEITDQARRNYEMDSNLYFDDYKDRIVKSFNKDSFYMSPEGIIIYYQQYDIAPYSTGIVEFTIPYTKIGWIPSC